MKQLASKEGRINFAPEVALFTYIVMAYVVFSIDVDTDPDWREGAEKSYAVLTRSQTSLGILGHVPWMYSVNTRFPGLIWQNDEFTAFARKLVERRKQVCRIRRTCMAIANGPRSHPKFRICSHISCPPRTIQAVLISR